MAKACLMSAIVVERLLASTNRTRICFVHQTNDIFSTTGQPRYLKVQGNGGNTSRYPKFDIAKM